MVKGTTHTHFSSPIDHVIPEWYIGSNSTENNRGIAGIKTAGVFMESFMYQ